jgi:hypothetical protein
VVASLTAATTGSQRLQELRQVASLVTAPMTAQLAEPEASSMLLEQMTEHQNASGQISHAPEDQPTTARRKRAGQIDLPITRLVVLNHAVPIQEANVRQLLVLTVLGNLEHLAPTDLLLTDLTQTETHLTEEQEATTAQTELQIVQHVQTLIVLGNLVHLAPTDLLLTDLTQTDHQEPEATTDQSAHLTDQHDQTLTVLGNHVLQDLIVQGRLVVLHHVRTLASLIATATRSARTAFHATAQETTALLALAIRTQTRRLSSRTRF